MISEESNPGSKDQTDNSFCWKKRCSVEPSQYLLPQNLEAWMLKM